MCGESFYQYGRGPRSSLDRLGSAFFDGAIGAILRSHDLAIANVECVLSDVGYQPTRLRSHQMRARGNLAPRLREWGINLANLANNHILEHGRAAAIDTAQQLRAAGVDVVGAGPNCSFSPGLQAHESIANGLRVASIGACLLCEKYAYDGGVQRHQLTPAIQQLASRNDVVIVSLHWGTEYMDRPSGDQRHFAHELVRAGATLILGHHPHVPQGLERHSGALIAYSLGNFVFDQLLPDTRWGMILSCELEAHRVVAWDCKPVRLDDWNRPRPAAGLELTAISAELDRRSQLLISPALGPTEYRRIARHRDRDMRRLLREHLLRHVSRMPLRFAAQIIGRPILRRLSLW